MKRDASERRREAITLRKFGTMETEEGERGDEIGVARHTSPRAGRERSAWGDKGSESECDKALFTEHGGRKVGLTRRNVEGRKICELIGGWSCGRDGARD